MQVCSLVMSKSFLKVNLVTNQTAAHRKEILLMMIVAQQVNLSPDGSMESLTSMKEITLWTAMNQTSF